VLRAFRPEKIKGHCFLLVTNSIQALDAADRDIRLAARSILSSALNFGADAVTRAALANYQQAHGLLCDRGDWSANARVVGNVV